MRHLNTPRCAWHSLKTCLFLLSTHTLQQHYKDENIKFVRAFIVIFKLSLLLLLILFRIELLLNRRQQIGMAEDVGGGFGHRASSDQSVGLCSLRAGAFGESLETE